MVFYLLTKVNIYIILSNRTVQLTSTHSSLERRFSSLSRSITSKAWSVGANKVMFVKFIAEFSIIWEKMLKFRLLFRMSPMLPTAGFRTLSITWMIPLLAPWFETIISPPCITIVCQKSKRISLASEPANEGTRERGQRAREIDGRSGQKNGVTRE